ncbi:hypothetical protein ACXR6G_03975 [Ancylomarina sp. YFZ004]
MRKFIIILLVLSCLSSQAQNTKTIVLKQFLSDIITVDAKQINSQQPIISINEIAQIKAEKAITINRESIGSALIEAKNYKYCLISVDAHTLVRVISFKDSSPSGAWRASMPLCKGYIQKSGVLHEKKDYLKNLIGRPDSQIRIMYLFN